jgi:hypothetical protein
VVSLLSLSLSQEIVHRCFPDSTMDRGLVRIPEIFAEIKLYTRAFE